VSAAAISFADKRRMHTLAAKARRQLTSGEQPKVEAYNRIGSLLGILNSKARRALKRRTSNGKAKTHGACMDRERRNLVWQRVASSTDVSSL
jgi:hypothetical protein